MLSANLTSRGLQAGTNIIHECWRGSCTSQGSSETVLLHTVVRLPEVIADSKQSLSFPLTFVMVFEYIQHRVNTLTNGAILEEAPLSALQKIRVLHQGMGHPSSQNPVGQLAQLR